MIEKEGIEKKIQEIFFALKDSPSDLPPGLFSGQAGISLFFYNYYKHTKEEEAFVAFQDSLNQLIEEIHSLDNLFFSNGMAGVGWLLHFLYQQNMVSNEVLDILAHIDGFMENHLDINYEISDFMHGALGLAFYFTERERFPTVESILEALFADCPEGGNLFWVSKMLLEEDNSIDIINLSLAHGSAAVIAILSKFLSKQISSEKNNFSHKLRETIGFLQNAKANGPEDKYPGHCTFDLNGEPENIYARLSWCYGEMGIGLALWQAGCSLKDSSYKEEAVHIYRGIVEHKSLQENRIADACVCHGTAGIAHMYNRMYYNTKHPEFREAAIYWIDQTLKMAKFEDGIAGYKSWNRPDWVLDHGLLGGAAGIGLCLLSHLNEECAGWDQCILLS